MVAQGPEEIERGSGMKLAEIDLTGDEAIETATFDLCDLRCATCGARLAVRDSRCSTLSCAEWGRLTRTGGRAIHVLPAAAASSTAGCC
eukprot:1156016-Prymnesium_polylepis.1